MTPRVLAVAAFCVLSIAGCGSGGVEAAAPTIKVTAPVQDQIVRTDSVEVRGVVTPAAGTVVEVAGRKARVRASGVFDRVVPLVVGENVIDVIAVGKKPATTSVTVTRGRTQQEIDKAIAKRRAKRQAAAAVRRSTAVVPDLVGEELDIAQARLSEIGFSYDTVGGGVAGIVNETNWTVCETTPAAGARKAIGATVTLAVRRIC